MDALAKVGTTLFLPMYTIDSPTDICLQATEAPTPANKWISSVRGPGVIQGVHWAAWLPGGIWC